MQGILRTSITCEAMQGTSSTNAVEALTDGSRKEDAILFPCLAFRQQTCNLAVDAPLEAEIKLSMGCDEIANAQISKDGETE